MKGYRITFTTDPTEEEPHQDWRMQTQKRHVNNLLPILVKHSCSFHFYINMMRETEEDSPYPELMVLTKTFWGYEDDEIRKVLKDIHGVKIEMYAACEAPECYEHIAAEKLPVPLFTRRGTEDDYQGHPISECCKYHLDARAEHILKTIETIDEAPDKKKGYVYIHVFPLWHRWIAQIVWEEENYDGWENPNRFKYTVASPWLIGKTRDLAIQAARDYEE